MTQESKTELSKAIDIVLKALVDGLYECEAKGIDTEEAMHMVSGNESDARALRLFVEWGNDVQEVAKERKIEIKELS